MSNLHSQDYIIKFKQGLAANINATATVNSAVEGEPHWTTDTDQLYVFNGAENVRVPTADTDGDVHYQDGDNIFFGTGDDMSIYYDGTQGNIKTDLVAASDLHVDCGTDKTVVLDEVVWDDMRIVPGSFDRPGIADPQYVAYYPNDGELGMYLPEFATDDFASFTVQLPHGYKQGEDIYVHLHWTPGTNGAAENGNLVGWTIDYTWANINGTFADMQSLDLSDACDGTDHKHQMTTDVVIDGHTSAKNISSMLLCNIRRVGTTDVDTWTGTASGELPMLLEVDFHYPIDTVGSRQIGAK